MRGRNARTECAISVSAVHTPRVAADPTPPGHRAAGVGVCKSVYKAVANVNDKIATELAGLDVRDQEGIDQLTIDLDGTPTYPIRSIGYAAADVKLDLLPAGLCGKVVHAQVTAKGHKSQAQDTPISRSSRYTSRMRAFCLPETKTCAQSRWI
jgi:hypothetical protein